MKYSGYKLRINIAFLLIATLLVQSSVVITGFLFRLSVPEHQVGLPGTPSQSQLLEAPVTADTAGKIELPQSEILPPDSQEAPKQKISVIEHVVKSGDTLTRIWEKHTGSSSGGIMAAEAFKQAKIPLSSLRKGEKLELQISSSGEITGLRKKLSNGRVLILDGDSTQGYNATVIQPDLVQTEKTATGTIRSSFSAAAGGVDVPYEVVDALVDLLSGKMEFRRDLQPGDSFTVTYLETKSKDGEVVKPCQIKSASILNRGSLYAAVAHTTKEGKTHYYDENGESIGRYFLRYPVRFTRISSVFSNSRLHPILKTRRPHRGVDLAAPYGTPVRAVADGVVQFSGYSGGGAGKMVKIVHSSKYQTVYMHLASIAKGVSKRRTVKRGQIIGTVGSTGLSTGPHLDYRLSVNGLYVDPLKAKLPAMPTSKDPIPPAYLEATLMDLRQSHQVIAMIAANQSDALSQRG